MFVVSYDKLALLGKVLQMTAFHSRKVAQWVMVFHSNQNVAGSNPTGSLLKIETQPPFETFRDLQVKIVSNKYRVREAVTTSVI